MQRKEFLKKGVMAGTAMSGAAAWIQTGQSQQTPQYRDSVLWEELSWPRIKELSEQNAIAIIPVGSIEQHGPHLPVSTDSINCSEVSRRVAERLTANGHPAVVTPRVWTGVSPHHMLFPGTLSFDYDLFSSILKQVCFCLKEHGFTRL